jgi:hypothetical protein
MTEAAHPRQAPAHKVGSGTGVSMVKIINGTEFLPRVAGYLHVSANAIN